MKREFLFCLAMVFGLVFTTNSFAVDALIDNVRVDHFNEVNIQGGADSTVVGRKLNLNLNSISQSSRRLGNERSL